MRIKLIEIISLEILLKLNDDRRIRVKDESVKKMSENERLSRKINILGERNSEEN